MANVENNLKSKLSDILKNDTGRDVLIEFLDKNNNEVEPNKATDVFIFGEGIWKTIKLPKKKLVDTEYIMNKINSESLYKNFTDIFKKFLKQNYKDYFFSVYPASYGIGIHNILSNNVNQVTKDISNILYEMDISYNTEYSDANWVLRFKISKSKENISRIKKATKNLK